MKKVKLSIPIIWGGNCGREKGESGILREEDFWAALTLMDVPGPVPRSRLEHPRGNAATGIAPLQFRRNLAFQRLTTDIDPIFHESGIAQRVGREGKEEWEGWEPDL